MVDHLVNLTWALLEVSVVEYVLAFEGVAKEPRHKQKAKVVLTAPGWMGYIARLSQKTYWSTCE